MRSRTTAAFRSMLASLPPRIQDRARKAYRLFRANPRHPSLCFKQVHPKRPIYSLRITKGYRAVGLRDERGMLWFWAGSHSDYNRLLAQL